NSPTEWKKSPDFCKEVAGPVPEAKFKTHPLRYRFANIDYSLRNRHTEIFENHNLATIKNIVCLFTFIFNILCNFY
ncbi:MAG: hypothetical protein LUG16_00910, partial [Candidatus Gastranaerophilales bacterium]|nr:hypothetical protein [Candidatus Gastranaerophilales bacterium]